MIFDLENFVEDLTSSATTLKND